jgi:hypothetical protein
MGNELNREFSKEEQMANVYMKKCSIALAVKEMKNQNEMRFYIIQPKWPSLRKQPITNADGEAGGKGALIHHWC